MDYKECLEECEKVCESNSTKYSNFQKDKCKNACPFYCKCVQTCSSERSIGYCKEKFCSSYLVCEATCKEESNFCKRVCEFDPRLNWIFLRFGKLGSAHFYCVENVNQDNVKVWWKVIFSNKAKQKLGSEYKKADYQIALFEIDCVEKKLRGLKRTIYDLDASIIDTYREPGEWEYVPPGSIGRDLLEEVCKEQEQRREEKKHFKYIVLKIYCR